MELDTMIKEKTGRAFKSLIALNEGPWRWNAGIQAALAMGLPLGIFTLFGYQSLGLMANLGGFTALYCVAMHRRDRMRILPFIAAGLVLVSASGVLCSGNTWLSIANLIAVALLASILTLGTGIGPPGPLMFILVTAVSGHIAARSHLNESYFGLMTLPLLVALGALLAYIGVVLPLLVPSVRNRTTKAYHAISSRINLDKKAIDITIRVVVGVAITSIVGLAIGANRSYWVMIPAVAVLQAGQNRRNTTIRAFHRILGTILGLGLFALIKMASPAGLWLVAVIMLLQFAIEVVVTKNYGLGLIFITPVALTIATATQPESYIFSVRERVIDTLIGSAIALLIFWIDEWLRNRNSKV